MVNLGLYMAKTIECFLRARTNFGILMPKGWLEKKEAGKNYHAVLWRQTLQQTVYKYKYEIHASATCLMHHLSVLHKKEKESWYHDKRVTNCYVIYQLKSEYVRFNTLNKTILKYQIQITES